MCLLLLLLVLLCLGEEIFQVLTEGLLLVTEMGQLLVDLGAHSLLKPEHGISEEAKVEAVFAVHLLDRDSNPRSLDYRGLDKSDERALVR